MHGLDKVARVSHVPGSASGVRRSLGWAPSALDGRLSQPLSSRWLSRPAHSAADGGGRWRFGGVASTSVAIFTFRARVWLWVLWDERLGNGCSAQMSEPARAGSVAGVSDPFRQLSQWTSTCVIPWGSRRRGAVWIRPFLCTSLCRRLISTGIRRHSSNMYDCWMAGSHLSVHLATPQQPSGSLPVPARWRRHPSAPEPGEPESGSSQSRETSTRFTTRKFQLSKLAARARFA